MSAYIIIRVNVTDMEQYREYTKHTPPAIEKYGGRFIVRGGDVVTLEGPIEKNRIVVIEFDSVEKAQAFYNSPEYQAAIQVRKDAAEASFIVVPGVS